jgi:phenylpropionate dioxygenase-like ring-hydroxylating dioxygenase large terminal subunit
LIYNTTHARRHQQIQTQKQTEFHALIDSCPHKKVALSEGRITTGPTCGSYLQCSYHGWTFDGYNGQCVEIPQTVIARRREHERTDVSTTKSNDNANKAKRQDAKSIAITEAQGMIWLHPSKSPLEALNIEGPPRIPELDTNGYRATVAVRDFPIDWTVLMENIMG